MGKYMRKAKITRDVAVMELPQSSSLGVRTRAKTLALQRQEASAPPPPIHDSSAYLQLRNRRLQKLNDVVKPTKSTCKQNPPPPYFKLGNSRSGDANSVFAGSDSEGEKGDFGRRNLGANEGGREAADLGTEASFGENNLEFDDGRERSTRESTPCSLIKGSETVATPGSSTRPTRLRASNPRTRDSIQRDIPTTHEIKEFFTLAEQQQQRLFTEKYNFDVVNDIPLPGRYEWVRI